MADALTTFVTTSRTKFDAIIGIGGSGGTALITPAMQALPVGFPKLVRRRDSNADLVSAQRDPGLRPRCGRW